MLDTPWRPGPPPGSVHCGSTALEATPLRSGSPTPERLLSRFPHEFLSPSLCVSALVRPLLHSRCLSDPPPRSLPPPYCPAPPLVSSCEHSASVPTFLIPPLLVPLAPPLSSTETRCLHPKQKKPAEKQAASARDALPARESKRSRLPRQKAERSCHARQGSRRRASSARAQAVRRSAETGDFRSSRTLWTDRNDQAPAALHAVSRSRGAAPHVPHKHTQWQTALSSRGLHSSQEEARGLGTVSPSLDDRVYRHPARQVHAETQKLHSLLETLSELRATVVARLDFLRASVPPCPRQADLANKSESSGTSSSSACLSPSSAAACRSPSSSSSAALDSPLPSEAEPTEELIAEALAAAARLISHLTKECRLEVGRASPAEGLASHSSGTHAERRRVSGFAPPCTFPPSNEAGDSRDADLWPAVGSFLSDPETLDALWPTADTRLLRSAGRGAVETRPERDAAPGETRETPLETRGKGETETSRRSDAGGSIASRGRARPSRLRGRGPPTARGLSREPKAHEDSETEGSESERRATARVKESSRRNKSSGDDKEREEGRVWGVWEAQQTRESASGDTGEVIGDRETSVAGKADRSDEILLKRIHEIQTEQFLRALALCLPYLSLEDRIGGVALASKACLQVVWSAPIHSADFCASGRKTSPQQRSLLCPYMHCSPRQTPQVASSLLGPPPASACLHFDRCTAPNAPAQSLRTETSRLPCCPSSRSSSSSLASSSSSSSSSAAAFEHRRVSGSACALARLDGVQTSRLETRASSPLPHVVHEIDGEHLLMLPLFLRRLAPRLTRLQALAACAASVPLISCLGVTLRRLMIDKVQAPQQLHIVHAWICAACRRCPRLSSLSLICDPTGSPCVFAASPSRSSLCCFCCSCFCPGAPSCGRAQHGLAFSDSASSRRNRRDADAERLGAEPGREDSERRACPDAGAGRAAVYVRSHSRRRLGALRVLRVEGVSSADLLHLVNECAMPSLYRLVVSTSPLLSASDFIHFLDAFHLRILSDRSVALSLPAPSLVPYTPEVRVSSSPVVSSPLSPPRPAADFPTSRVPERDRHLGEPGANPLCLHARRRQLSVSSVSSASSVSMPAFLSTEAWERYEAAAERARAAAKAFADAARGDTCPGGGEGPPEGEELLEMRRAGEEACQLRELRLKYGNNLCWTSLLTSLSAFCSLRLLDLSSSSATFGVATRFFHASVAFVSLPIHEDLSWVLSAPNLRVLRLTASRSLCSATCDVKKLVRRLPEQLAGLSTRAPKLLLVYVHLTVDPSYGSASAPPRVSERLLASSRPGPEVGEEASPRTSRVSTFSAGECEPEPTRSDARPLPEDLTFRLVWENECRQLESDARDLRGQLEGEEEKWRVAAAHPSRPFSFCFCLSRELEPLLDGNRLPISALPDCVKPRAEHAEEKRGTAVTLRRSSPSSSSNETVEEKSSGGSASTRGSQGDAREERERKRERRSVEEREIQSRMDEMEEDIRDLFLRDERGSECEGDIVNPACSFGLDDWLRLKAALRELPSADSGADKVHLLRGRRAKDLYAFWRIF
ncbi:hypothetical protein TGDOM2_267760 [Toxoplasma gondii GAB2-2007-GAL-DOM2]|uniref:Uncharacterized protein n=5 Tax=Toxoplasma gondii TaxID=5811 RepID=S7VVY8_TOXGG|nr:hypothetical protein TGGT1_267760 [Toxoplasma gondii GT1]KAF4644036.1 hypothetical protein TGRH88_010340 [Toxoplasma gondii]KFG38912.1 hypothetical protein TGDOM2_267760 [Toxoplasma gondii GAB2-2007-GAL-DOM2]KFG42665.1 hypothetical protein TGFOU_267760 [Toxoplasma gondii FOU]RQX74219.1 hypothetical protein TGCAST_267760 [Toxoplasma gondii CAST]